MKIALKRRRSDKQLAIDSIDFRLKTVSAGGSGPQTCYCPIRADQSMRDRSISLVILFIFRDARSGLYLARAKHVVTANVL